MNILIIGAGGREHALAWAVHRSPLLERLYIAPGNPGTARLGTNVPIAQADTDAILAFAREHAIDLTIVGPEQPLVDGIVDAFEEAGLPIFGPTRRAAQLEASKVFAKDFMERYGIPTAACRRFKRDELEAARAYVGTHAEPLVVKASGLAAGKGAVVCETRRDAEAAVEAMLGTGTLGAAGEEIVVEAFMEGEEASIFALTDGERYVLLPPAQDHKRIGEGDTGPNTGGMGAYAPAPLINGALLSSICRDIVEPTLGGMLAEGHPYRGVLYIGVMVTADGPKVVEYNCRFGDPETQAVLPLLEDDLVPVLSGIANGRLTSGGLRTGTGSAACVVLASDGYPGAYRTGVPITGDLSLDSPEAIVFQAGTKQGEQGEVETAGGRVLNVVGRAPNLAQALHNAYAAADDLSFDGMQLRRDIGRKGLRRSKQRSGASSTK